MKSILVWGCFALFGLTLWGCNTAQNVTPDTLLSSARLTGDVTGFHCRDDLTTVAITALPASVTAHIASNYSGAVINYAVKDDTGNFLVAITRSSGRTALLFNADGTFNKELALRGHGKGHGPGDHGQNRDNLTVVAVADLPAAIRTYIAATYAGATINVAAKDANRGYIVSITLNGVAKALLFNLDGTFAQEVVRGVKGPYTVVEASTLPAKTTAYITTTYAGATIKLVGKSATGQFKVFIQLTTGQLLELSFAADGTFVQAHKGKGRR